MKITAVSRPYFALLSLLWRRDHFLNLLINQQLGAASLRLPLLGKQFYFVTDPQFTRFIYAKTEDLFEKAPFVYNIVKQGTGNGILTSTGALWQQQRQIVNPAFTAKCIHQYEATFIALADEMIAGWMVAAAEGEPVNASTEMTRITMRIILATMFSTELMEDSEVISAAVLGLNRDCTRKIKSLVRLPLWLPSPANRRIRRNRQIIEQVVTRILRERTQGPTPAHDDLAARLLDSHQTLSQQVMDELLTIFLGGHETTSSLLTYTLFCLAKHPAIQTTLRRHIQDVIGDGEVSIRALAQLSYLKNVIHEAIRLYTPIISPVRTSVRPFNYTNIEFPKNAVFFLCHWSANLNAALWDRPGVFDPDRFNDNRLTDEQMQAFTPFGAGPRVCVGMRMSLVEAQIILLKILSQFEIALEGDYELTINRNVTTSASEPLHLRLREISPPAGKPLADRCALASPSV